MCNLVLNRLPTLSPSVSNCRDGTSVFVHELKMLWSRYLDRCTHQLQLSCRFLGLCFFLVTGVCPSKTNATIRLGPNKNNRQKEQEQIIILCTCAYYFNNQHVQHSSHFSPLSPCGFHDPAEEERAQRDLRVPHAKGAVSHQSLKRQPAIRAAISWGVQ